ncbi:MAG: hypothetical protein ISS70_18520 [Phycisphaerae bacterium]|nr:hypothetical protein [Phycisphaerae bacterium]
MITAPTMTSGANNVILALTPIERWQAVRRLASDLVGEQSFALVCGAVLIVLTVLLIVASYGRKKKDRKSADQLFGTYANERGLSRREQTILLEIAGKAKLRRSESIFTLASAFSLGAAQVTGEVLASQGARASRRLRVELTVLREKLGFRERVSDSVGSAATLSKPSSRHIPVDKNLQIIRHEHERADIEATVIKNDDIELAVRLSKPLEAGPGQVCRVHYYYGASVWEFDASVVSCHGGILVLAHSYDVRFINRRRFFRVPVKKPAFIARFPFAKTLPSGKNDDESAAGDLPYRWGLPEFVPATVTELGGPGLRVEAPLEVEVGERVLVILKMNGESAADRHRVSPRSGHRTPRSSRIVEDIGEVRHVTAIEDGFSIAIELTGLSDSNINELIRETNSASIEAGASENGMVVEAAEQIAV